MADNESKWCEVGNEVYCDRCGVTFDNDTRYHMNGGNFVGSPFPFNYCPNCGARMKFIEVGGDLDG